MKDFPLAEAWNNRRCSLDQRTAGPPRYSAPLSDGFESAGSAPITWENGNKKKAFIKRLPPPAIGEKSLKGHFRQYWSHR
jgi:hypothetical protein